MKLTQDLDQHRRVFVRRLLAWGRVHRRDFPWRTEKDPFRILIAEVLLQRSRGVTVAKVYPNIFNCWPNAAALASASEKDIANVIRPLGLVSRATTLRSLAMVIAIRGGVPTSHDELLLLPGVGRYVAAATAAVAFGIPEPTVDGVTARVYRRYFGLTNERPVSADRNLWRIVERVTPRSTPKEWNWAVLDLASSVCLPKIPRCSECPLLERCLWARAPARSSRSRHVAPSS